MGLNPQPWLDTMDTLPTITIITPSYNQAAYIESSIRSVLDQAYPHLEFLVYDACSRDGTVDILKRYSDQVRWVSEPDRGQTDAINKGMLAAQGEIIGILNSDDELEPGALKRIGEYFRDHPDCPWLTGRCVIIDPQGKEVLGLVTRYKEFLLSLRIPALLKIVNYISQPSTFWRRSLVAEVGWMDETLDVVMDYDYWLRISARHPMGYINVALARFRTYPSSKTRMSALHQYDEELRVIRRYSSSPVLRFFHYIHRMANILAYSKILGKRQ